MEKMTLNLLESNTLEFETEITGVTSDKIDVRYVITNEGIEYAFIGRYDNGVVTIDLPSLSTMFEAKTYESKLTFIVEGNRYFEPMHILSEMIQPVTITTTMKESTKQTVEQKPAVVTEESISVSTIKVTPKKDLMERMKDALVDIKEASNLTDVISIYKKDVLLNENSKVSNKEAVSFIDSYCRGELGKTLKEFIK